MLKMKKLSSFLIVLVLSGITTNSIADTVTSNKIDQNTSAMMTLPAPIQNKVFDSMVGSWQGQSDMMGTKMNDILKIRWDLNHQFLVLELTSTEVANPNIQYNGLGIFGISNNGGIKTWWFDNWGADAMSQGSGKFGDNKLTITDGNTMFQETRSFEISGNQMIMHAKGKMTNQGKEIDFNNKTNYQKVA